MNRRTGKIARFPKDLRELINNMLDDGAQYESIIRALDKHRHRWPDGVNDLSINNMSNWHSGGYQDWLRHQELVADLRSRNDSLAELLEGADPARLHETVLHLGNAQLYHAIAGFDRDTVATLSSTDPAAYARVVTVFQRFSQQTLLLQKLKVEAARHNQPHNDAARPAFEPKALPPHKAVNEPESTGSENNSSSIPGNSQ